MPGRWDKIDKVLQDAFFVTGNRFKLEEVEAVLGKMRHVDLDLPELQELEPRKVVIAKAQAALNQGYSPVLIEDTSLSLVALNGLPGPLIKWFLKALGSEGVYQLAATRNDCRAEVRTIFGLALGPQSFIYGEGIVAGEVVPPRGSGFGWDSIFQPTGSSKTMGEMSKEEKALFSMRVKALHDLRNQLERFYQGQKHGQKEPPKG
ncbi:MAG: non-canonical purine NTP pyrophosphatase [Proteobacteria bacterium]|jgi:inosine triphosphate pyrophosphatase|nr:non-canonical purine NTP pyrophosphatase [Pseudomonadota bacterium]